MLPHRNFFLNILSRIYTREYIFKNKVSFDEH